MSLWWMKKCVKPCKYLEIFRLNSRLCTRVLKVWELSPWTPQTSKRRLPNSSKKKSSSSPRSTFSKIRATAKTFKRFWKQPQSWGKSRNKTQDSMRKNASSPRRLKWTSISCSRSGRDSWTPKRSQGRTMAPNRCSTTYAAKLGLTERFVTKWSVVNLMTKRSAFKGSKCFSRSPWQLNLNLKGWHQM
jgi:hypothetical protein